MIRFGLSMHDQGPAKPVRAARPMSRWAERAWALSAAVLIPVALTFLSVPRTLALCDRWPGSALLPHPPGSLALRVRRWLRRGRGPWTSSCLTRSLVLYVMLRQHGYDARFCVGVAGNHRKFDAHAWVTLGGQAVGDPPGVPAAYTPLLSHRA